MNKELKEKIAETLPCFRDIFDRMPCPYDGKCNQCGDIREAVDHLVIIIKEAGYRKKRGEPPVLTKDQLDAIDLRNAESNFIDALYDTAREQRKADMKFYNG